MLKIKYVQILQDQWKVFFLLLLEFTGEDVELVPRDVDASNDDVIEHGFHEDVNHTNILRFRRRLGNVDDVVEFGFFVGDGFAVETGVFSVVLVIDWNED